MLHLETIEPTTLELLKKLQKNPLLKNTRLVGGTALALQIGHRKSIDIDLFGEINCDQYELVESLTDIGQLKTIKESPNIHIYQLNGVKLDIVNYKYSWIKPERVDDNIILADLEDIAAMKTTAIIGRGTKKDFIDMAFLLDFFSLEDILCFYEKKYPEASRFIAMKSITYFDDAEDDPMPLMIKKISWENIKEKIQDKINLSFN